MDKIKKIIKIVAIAFILWCILSYIDIVINNTGLNGGNVFSDWNLFMLLRL